MSTTEEQTVADDWVRRQNRAKRLIAGMMERTEERGCSEAEAMEAAVKIGALLEEYDLELTDCMARDVSNMVTKRVFAADPYAQSVVTGIGLLCGLQTYLENGQQVTTFVMFGHSADVELAVYLYTVCAQAVDNDWVADSKVNGHTVAKRNSFRMGFSNRVCQRLRELRRKRDEEQAARIKVSGCTDLVLLKDQIVLAEFEKTGIKLVYRKQKVADRAAYYRGTQRGDHVNLNRPLTGPGSQELLG